MNTMVIVEDEYIERDALATLVDWQSMGVTVTGCFESGAEALAHARLQPFDVLFTDIRLLDMSGLALSKEILALQPDVRVIINSGYSEFEYAREAIRLKAVSYLTKPLDLEELRQTVEETVRLIEEERGKRHTAEHLSRLVEAQRPVSLHEIMRLDHEAEASSEEAQGAQGEGHTPDRNIIRRMMAYIEAHPEAKLTADHLARLFHFSPSYIGIAFRKDTGKTLTDYVRAVRMEKARELLREPGSRVSEVAARVGYPNVSYFCAVFRRAFGINPGEYREHA